MTLKPLKYLGLIVVLGLAGCEVEFAPNGPDTEQAPVVNSLRLNGESALNDRALVVRESQLIEVVADVSSSAELESIEILVSLDEKAYTTLATCDSSPCSYDWAINASDNGLHSFRVEATDVRGGFSRLPYSSSLVVEIP